MDCPTAATINLAGSSSVAATAIIRPSAASTGAPRSTYGICRSSSQRNSCGGCHCSRSPTRCAGAPATTVYGSTSSRTTEFAPTTAPLPTVTPGPITTFVPSQQSSSTHTGLSSELKPPSRFRRWRSCSRIGKCGCRRNGWVPEETNTLGANIHPRPTRTVPRTVQRRCNVVPEPNRNSVSLSSCTSEAIHTSSPVVRRPRAPSSAHVRAPSAVPRPNLNCPPRPSNSAVG